MRNVIDFIKAVLYKARSFFAKIEYYMVTDLRTAVEYAPHSSLALMAVGDIAFLFTLFEAFKNSNKSNRKKLIGGLGIIYAICGIIATIAIKKEAPKNIRYETEGMKEGMKGWDDLE